MEFLQSLDQYKLIETEPYRDMFTVKADYVGNGAVKLKIDMFMRSVNDLGDE
jgi:hypothetical protein